MAVFWFVAPYSLVERFRGTCCLRHQGALIIEAACTSETLVHGAISQKDSHLQYISNLNYLSYNYCKNQMSDFSVLKDVRNRKNTETKEKRHQEAHE
jgi:hypothetical protein